MEAQGLAGLHLEDQVNPKRCGHLDGKQLVPVDAMVRKLVAAVAARRDPNFLLIARTDARGVEGLDAAVRRARAYVAAGADVVFCEALESLAEYRAFHAAIDVPLLANMTEFGKTPLFDLADLERVGGVGIVLYPVTTLRLAMGAVEQGLRRLAADGHQRALLGSSTTATERSMPASPTTGTSRATEPRPEAPSSRSRLAGPSWSPDARSGARTSILDAV